MNTLFKGAWPGFSSKFIFPYLIIDLKLSATHRCISDGHVFVYILRIEQKSTGFEVKGTCMKQAQ